MAIAESGTPGPALAVQLEGFQRGVAVHGVTRDWQTQGEEAERRSLGQLSHRQPCGEARRGKRHRTSLVCRGREPAASAAPVLGAHRAGTIQSLPLLPVALKCEFKEIHLLI